MKKGKEILTREINTNLDSLEELVVKLEQKKNDVSRGIFRKGEFREINADYLFTLSRLKFLGEETLEYQERYESLIKRSEVLFSLYIAYRKSRINPVKRKKPTHYKDDFSDGIEDKGRTGITAIRTIPFELFNNIGQDSYSNY